MVFARIRSGQSDKSHGALPDGRRRLVEYLGAPAKRVEPRTMNSPTSLRAVLVMAFAVFGWWYAAGIHETARSLDGYARTQWVHDNPFMVVPLLATFLGIMGCLLCGE